MATILLAEDETDLAYLLALHLRSAGHEVVAVPDGLEACTWLASHRADLVMTDLMMPRMDGRELVSHIRANRATAHVPVIILTASLVEVEGADVTLRKPAPLSLIVDLVESLLSAGEVAEAG
jgi:CheY-like chemotaxis protein